MAKTRKRSSVPWAGWAKKAPHGKQRTKMMRKCGRKCFLGPNKKFPICTKGTCKVNPKGVYASYVRSRQWGKSKKSYNGRSKPSMKRGTYAKVARTAKKMLRKLGFRVGKSSKRNSRTRKH
jgi:hypothetical protein